MDRTPRRLSSARKPWACWFPPSERAPCAPSPISTSAATSAGAPPSCLPKSSRPADFAGALAQQDLLFARKNEFAPLVVHARRERDDTGGTLRHQCRNLEHWVKCVTGKDRLQKFRRLLDKRDQRVADGEREAAGARRGDAQNLEAVRQRARVAAPAAVFDIALDRMIIAREHLEGGEMSLGHRAARDVETFADDQILEIAAHRKTVLSAVKALCHGNSCCWTGATLRSGSGELPKPWPN